VDFDVGVFTNLTRDHLDYHGTIDRYFAAKAMLFRGLGQMEKTAAAVINIDDDWGQQLANIGGGWSAGYTYGFHPAADIRAENAVFGDRETVFRLRSPWGDADARLRTMGRFNVQNALAAIGACGAGGTPLPVMVEALSAFTAAPGRLEPVPNTRGLRIYVDYAHTDDALDNVLGMLRGIAPRRLIVVFGCGGDRDRGKRPLMGAVAARWADHTIVTSDNPRSEDPLRIIEEIVAGIPAGATFEVEVDREPAIARAFERARSGDIVLIAGKGHENYQEFDRTVIPFDDREVARRLLG
jgi:UDP-N-acetylmuramyl-tripeptide synthetase